MTWWLLSICAFILVVVVIAVGALWWNSTQNFDVKPAQTAEAVEPVLGPAEGGDGAPNVVAAVARTSKDKDLGKLSAEVTDVLTGQVVWTSDENRPLVPASSTKLFTAAAALLALPADDRQETYVVQQKPGELIVAGEGDVTLSNTPGDGFFTDAASVKELADSVKKNLGDQKITRIVVDNSVRGGATFNRAWDRADIAGGNVTDVDSVMLNAGRIQPLQADSARSTTPAEDVAASLANFLGATNAEISVQDKTPASDMLLDTTGSAVDHLPDGLTWLGGVESAPLKTRLRDMLINSDNILAEATGREIAESQGAARDFTGATESTLKVLADNGLDVGNAVLTDNSGMSNRNRLTAHDLDGVLSNEKLRALLDMLPVASAEGTLRSRYNDGSGAEASAGWVRAKTGTLDGVNALAGTVTTKEGRPLTFAFLSNDAETTLGRAALDRLANSLRNAQ
ncbi:D-alanyl-D-alanine carboxypeptidase/D-alanyl-D-alanine-endopeptidase [Corynebacterium sp. 4HC-13]|uniref:D-alanyl-D-alanine carboxypeptidase/D-alanyl-D-alanine-endopeptidase n=1 Tax=Corynebacterium anserum TaxID=2684406 RepID=A0A7G7YQT1_9CORY|nr:D-alanyl-D-alanine carboxypeptidase/D-alanyl-D-alanine-endopeptidase [Corynebacterium anserum]QNH96851.1 D-alanyl-D-alanine carboxypeptidase/D-alanyl-D-alanine-endopeptidase [Corynebacterium anserum]